MRRHSASEVAPSAVVPPKPAVHLARDRLGASRRSARPYTHGGRHLRPGAPRIYREPARGFGGLLGRAARETHGRSSRPNTPKAGGAVDGRPTRGRGWPLAFGVRGALRGARWRATPRVSHAPSHAEGNGAPAGGRDAVEGIA